MSMRKTKKKKSRSKLFLLFMHADKFACLQININESKRKQKSGMKCFLFPWSQMLGLVLLCFCLLLLLYAEAAWLSRVKEACISCKLPRASVWSSTWRLSPRLSASLFCKWVVVGGSLLHRLRRSGVLLGSAVGSNRIHSLRVRSVLLLSNYCISQSMRCHDSTVESVRGKWARLLSHVPLQLGF